jgi:hypothetical protein
MQLTLVVFALAEIAAEGCPIVIEKVLKQVALVATISVYRPAH